MHIHARQSDDNILGGLLLWTTVLTTKCCFTTDIQHANYHQFFMCYIPQNCLVPWTSLHHCTACTAQRSRRKPFDMKSDAKYSDPVGLGVFERERECPSTTNTTSSAPLHQLNAT